MTYEKPTIETYGSVEQMTENVDNYGGGGGPPSNPGNGPPSNPGNGRPF